MKRIIVATVLILAVLVLYLSFFTVSERECAVVTQFSKPIKTVEVAGLHFKLPIQKVNRFDKRINVFKTQPIQLLLGDKNPIIITCYICWKIRDPLVFFQSVKTFENTNLKLSDMLNSQLGSILGSYSIDNIINTESKEVKLAEIEETILRNTNERTREKYGVQIEQIGIRRIAYPSVVSDAVYERMKSERRRESSKYRAEGKEEAAKIEAKTDRQTKEILAEAYEKSEIIKGEGDSRAMKIYAQAYGQDPEFFRFLKSLEVYQDILKMESTLIISTESELFKYLDLEESLGK